jgi:tetratricopeptide (TPR) repeat protein
MLRDVTHPNNESSTAMMPEARQATTVRSGISLLDRCATLFVATSIVLLASSTAYGQGLMQCGKLDNAYGPFDYTNQQHFSERLPVVENAHFTPEVETFVGHDKCGGNGCMVANDIDYTLRAFPNHHRALLAMSRYHLRGLDETKRPMRYTPECYFDRALRFKSTDSTVHMIYGYYLSKSGKPQEALQRYARALELSPDSAEAHYNVGLLYTDRKEYAQAREHAKRAYELGFPLPGLRRKLERAGEWESQESAEPSLKQ